ncbi:MAG: hypothetical protein PHP82_03195 [Candidatus ainarchaeum sp.]|nr:hypothetical protein [Candidatus ainarchaeum sp.]
MSLGNPDEEYEEIINKKHKSKGKIGRIFSKTKLFLILIIIGLIIGILFGHFYIEPFLENTTSQLKICIDSKELLSAENLCLYKSINNPQEIINQCKIS